MLLKVRIDRSQSQHFISTDVDRNASWRQIWLKHGNQVVWVIL